MALLTTQVAELTQERKVLLDRLATLGLGGPLFSLASSDDSSGSEDPVDPEVDEIESLLKSRRRPSKLADALTRKAYRDYHRVQTGAHVKWIPKVEAVTAALDEAEVSGKLNSSLGS